MLKRLFAFVFGYLLRFLLQDRGGSQSSFFDVDLVFRRLTEMSDVLLAKLQRILLMVFAATAFTALAITVLTIRIFQLSAGATVPFGGFQIDGAIFFGLILAVCSGILTWALFGRRRETTDDKIRRARQEWEREKPTEIHSHPGVSPLEEALALWIRRSLEEKETTKASPPPTSMAEGEPETPSGNSAHSRSHAIPEA